MDNYIVSSEGMSAGHPDKVADLISDSIVDACLVQDPGSRVACEALVKGNTVVVAGEVSTRAALDVGRVVRGAVEAAGYRARQRTTRCSMRTRSTSFPCSPNKARILRAALTVPSRALATRV